MIGKSNFSDVDLISTYSRPSAIFKQRAQLRKKRVISIVELQIQIFREFGTVSNSTKCCNKILTKSNGRKKVNENVHKILR